MRSGGEWKSRGSGGISTGDPLGEDYGRGGEKDIECWGCKVGRIGYERGPESITGERK